MESQSTKEPGFSRRAAPAVHWWYSKQATESFRHSYVLLNFTAMPTKELLWDPASCLFSGYLKKVIGGFEPNYMEGQTDLQLQGSFCDCSTMNFSTFQHDEWDRAFLELNRIAQNVWTTKQTIDYILGLIFRSLRHRITLKFVEEC